eukprot:TRINITY_DN4191_c0_g1_i1.p1 TRINITY_DN4191_c0_g1~~TRINITY_DN4191_c0_g1_i1.p1  ORF type:complete len:549 (+),score=192.79 TRINITY_DN4191_c0_g1_i1:48-1649(+)
MDVHGEWVDRMAKWLSGPPAEATPPTLGTSMDRLHARIAANTAKLEQQLEAAPPAPRAVRVVDAELEAAMAPKGVLAGMPAGVVAELKGVVEKLKDDLSKELVRALGEIGEAESKRQEALTRRLFDRVEEERKKIEQLEDVLLYGHSQQEASRRDMDAMLHAVKAAEQRDRHREELLPILNDIERAVLNAPPPPRTEASTKQTPSSPIPDAPPSSRIPPPPPGPPPGFDTPSHTAPLAPPPPPPPLSFHTSDAARGAAASIEQRKQAFHATVADVEGSRQRRLEGVYTPGLKYRRRVDVQAAPPPPPPPPQQPGEYVWAQYAHGHGHHYYPPPPHYAAAPPPPPPVPHSASDTASTASDRSSCARREARAPNTVEGMFRGPPPPPPPPGAHPPWGSGPPPMPLPAHASHPPLMQSQYASVATGGTASPPPPPPPPPAGPPPAFHYAPAQGTYLTHLNRQASRSTEGSPPPPPPGAPPAGAAANMLRPPRPPHRVHDQDYDRVHDQDYDEVFSPERGAFTGSNWQVEEAELTIY